MAGRSGNALDLNGTSGYAALPGGILAGATNFTIALWVRIDTVATWSRLFDFGTGTGANMFLTPRSSAGTARFAITTGGSGGEQRIDAPGGAAGRRLDARRRDPQRQPGRALRQRRRGRPATRR